MNTDYLKLCLVTHLQDMPLIRYQDLILQAIAGGVTSIQLRAKNRERADILDLAFAFKRILKPFNIPLIINDHVDIAEEMDAEGVHIGQSDLSPALARQQLGPSKIIGWSVESLADCERANELTCINYIGASAVFPSPTKHDCKMIWGVGGLEKIVQASRHPVVAIGGINKRNIQSVMSCGVAGVAIVSAIHDDPDPSIAAADLICAMNRSCKRGDLC